MISPVLSALVTLIAQIVQFLLQIGLIYMGLECAEDLPISYRQLFHALNWQVAAKVILVYVWQFIIFLPPIIVVLLATLLPNSVSFLRFLLFLIAFIAMLIIFFRLILAIGFVLKNDVTAWQAIKLSFHATRGNFWRLLALYIAEVMFVLISMIPLGIGLIWTIPFLIICYGVLYKTLANVPHATSVST
jgi:uncharacterized membrane protein